MDIHKIQIIETTSENFNDIIRVVDKAFNREDVVKLTAELLNDATSEPRLSLLAVYEGEAIGHILFTKVSFDNSEDEHPLMHILAPLAIKPEYQRKGVGGMLIKEGIKRLQNMGSNLLFVLGHKEYYPKYGFQPYAAKLGYEAPQFIPEKFGVYWMVQPISKDGFSVGKGKIKCAEMLDKPEHWRDENAIEEII